MKDGARARPWLDAAHGVFTRAWPSATGSAKVVWTCSGGFTAPPAPSDVVQVAAQVTDLPREQLAKLLDPAELTTGGIKGGTGGGA